MIGNQIQLTQYERYLRRKQAMWKTRSSWDSEWMDLATYLIPRSSRFQIFDKNKGGNKHQNIYDSTGTKALRTLAAGLMAGMTSPARPWFRLTTTDPELEESEAINKWLNDVTRLMQLVFNRSNTYRALHTMYEELGAFGTATAVQEENFENVIHLHPMTVGEYALAADDLGVINTMGREFMIPVSSLVLKFGYENCSLEVQNLWNNHNLDAEIPVCHLVHPRSHDQREAGKRDAKNMPFASVYFETGRNGVDKSKHDKMLRTSGYKQFPVLAPRWATVGNDVYGSNCPGIDSKGDVKQLQHAQKRKSQGIDYQTDPPLQVPTNYKGREGDLLPGGVSYVDAAGPGGGIRSAFDVRLDLQYLLEDIHDVRGRINSAFFADMFLMMANDQRSNITAREVAERHEEKLLMLGPVLERLHNELLAPLIDNTFERIMDAGILPPPPMELQGSELKVEFVSMLAQAQRAVGLGSIDRLIGTVANVSGIKPEVIDKIDFDQVVDTYAEMLGVDPDLVMADDQVVIIREQRAQAMAQQQQAANMPQVADTAKAMSETDTTGDNALTDAMRMFSGYGGA